MTIMTTATTPITATATTIYYCYYSYYCYCYYYLLPLLLYTTATTATAASATAILLLLLPPLYGRSKQDAMLQCVWFYCSSAFLQVQVVLRFVVIKLCNLQVSQKKLTSIQVYMPNGAQQNNMYQHEERERERERESEGGREGGRVETHIIAINSLNLKIKFYEGKKDRKRLL